MTIIFKLAGGVRRGKFKAVQIGGPSGGCLPEDKLATPVDYDALTKVGAMMGSGRHGRLEPGDLHGGSGPVLYFFQPE
ncbi:MAG: hypothetical protein ACOX20_10740 [Limnochordia bacterium]